MTPARIAVALLALPLWVVMGWLYFVALEGAFLALGMTAKTAGGLAWLVSYVTASLAIIWTACWAVTGKLWRSVE